MILVEHNDLLSVTHGIIMHQVNCMGAFNAGLAKQIREKYPSAYQEYNSLCNRTSPKKLLSTFQLVKINDNIIICNFFGQLYYGNNYQFTDYSAYETGLPKLIEFVSKNYPGYDIHIPYKLGCGLAGGDWKEVFGRFNLCFHNSDINLVIHSKE